MRRKWYYDIYVESRLDQWDVLEEIGEEDIQTYLDIKNGKITDKDKIKEFQSYVFYYDTGFDISDIIDKLDTNDITEELENRGYTIKDDEYDEEDDWYEIGKKLTKAGFIESLAWLKGFGNASRLVTKDELKEHLNKLIEMI